MFPVRPGLASAAPRRFALVASAALWLTLVGLLAPIHGARHRPVPGASGREAVCLVEADAECALCALAAQPVAPNPPPAPTPRPAPAPFFIPKAPTTAVPTAMGAVPPPRTGRAPPLAL